jgi:hypothetical protein
VERDEQIMALQDELDAYDRHHKELEEKLDEKTALLIRFQRISMEVSVYLLFLLYSTTGYIYKYI